MTGRGVRARRVVAYVMLAVAIVATVATSYASGAVFDEVEMGTVELSRREPSFTARFQVSATEQALSAPGASPGFQVWSDELELGRKDIGHPEVEVSLWSVRGDARTRVDLQRSHCHGNRCVGTFEICFSLAEGVDAARFSWKLSASVTFDGPDVPEGAAVDIHLVGLPTRYVVA